MEGPPRTRNIPDHQIQPSIPSINLRHDIGQGKKYKRIHQRHRLLENRATAQPTAAAAAAAAAAIAGLSSTHPPRKLARMAMVTAQVSPVAAFQPRVSKSRFLTGSPGKFAREFVVKTPAAAATSSKPLKIVAKKGEWLPGLASPDYLNGSLPGDNGFDPLGLAEDPENLRWYVQAELVNGRWAMLGVVGMLLPEVFTKIGIINAPQWYDAGKAEYFASSSTLFVIEFILFHYVEMRRWQDIKNPGCVNQDPIFKNYSLPPHECGYPGSVFNPLNFAPTLEAKEKELANGRLAMLAFLGFVVQHNVTGKGPFENLLQHISDPWHNTIIQTFRIY
ncbi:Chlorophyll a-b binding protein 4, chloroplastic [Asimina triloba]